jgi:DNA repair ATPase RecN
MTMKLYEIANALADESSYLNQETGEVDVELLDKLSVAYDQKVDSICTIIGEYDSEIAYIEQEIARLGEMKKRRQKRIDGLKNYLTFCIADKWSNSRYTVSVRSTQAVEADVDKIPDEYKRTTIKVEPDKKKLAESLKVGLVVPGATLKVNRSINIR